jgi:hypothetical protein
MTRRRTERPVERLRSGWTSTADLEETIAAMFQNPPVNLVGREPSLPPVNLTRTAALDDRPDATHINALAPPPPDILSEEMMPSPPDILTGAKQSPQPDILSGVKQSLPPVNLTRTAALDDRPDATHINALAPPPPDILSEEMMPSPPDILTGAKQSPQPDILSGVKQSLPPVNLTSNTSPGNRPDASTTTINASAPAPPPDTSVSEPRAASATYEPYKFPTPPSVQLAAVAPPDTLTGPLFETLDGLIVDAKCIRIYDNVQSAHTPSEHLVYTTMWKMLGSREDDGPNRDGILPMAAVASKVSISIRNLRRVLRSLEQKLALEVTEYEDKTRSIPRRYRVWGFRSTIERRRRAGYSHIYRNRNLITLARPYASRPPDNLTEVPGVNLPDEPPGSLTPGIPDNLAEPPPDNKTGKPPDNLSAFLITNKQIPNTTSSSSFSVSDLIAKTVANEFGIVDDDALRRMIRGCRARIPDATDEEIAEFAKEAAKRIRCMRNLVNPIGLLITQVPKYFEGQSFRLYREEKHKVQEAHQETLKQQCREAQAILDNPNSDSYDRHWAMTLLESIKDELSKRT